MPDSGDSNLPGTRSKNWVLLAAAIAIGLGIVYFVASMLTQPGTTIDGSAEPPPVEGTVEAPGG